MKPGTLLKRGRIFYFTISKVENGRRVRRKLSLKTTSREYATVLVRKIRERINNGEDVFSPEFSVFVDRPRAYITLHKAMEEFIQDRKAVNRSASTISAYKAVFDKFWKITKINPNSYLHKINKDIVRSFLLRDGINATTVRHDRRHLSAFFNYCIEQKYIQENPTRGISMPEVKIDHVAMMVTKSDIEAIHKAWEQDNERRQQSHQFRPWMNQEWFIPLLYTLFYSGLRRKEAVNLTVDNIADQRVIALNEGKSFRQRFIPIVKELEPWLQIALGIAKKNNCKYLFAKAAGQPVSVDHFSRTFAKYRELAGLPKAKKPHGIRHYRITQWLEQGFTIKDVADMAGHSTVAITDRVYSHLTKEYFIKKAKEFNQKK